MMMLVWQYGHKRRAQLNEKSVMGTIAPLQIASFHSTISAGNSLVTSEFPAQMLVTRSFDVFFDLRLNKRWVNNRGAVDLRRDRAYYDDTVKMDI